MSLINTTKKIYRPLAEGKYHVRFTSWAEVEPQQNSGNTEGYVRFEGYLTEDNRPIIDTRFQQSLNIMLSQIQQQLNLADGLTTLDAVNSFVDAGIDLDMYVSKNTDANGKEYTNYNYLPPLPTRQATQHNIESEDAFH